MGTLRKLIGEEFTDRESTIPRGLRKLIEEEVHLNYVQFQNFFQNFQQPLNVVHFLNINVQDLAKGVYTLTLVNDDKTVLRFIKR